jgi:hypothetical protein
VLVCEGEALNEWAHGLRAREADVYDGERIANAGSVLMPGLIGRVAVTMDDDHADDAVVRSIGSRAGAGAGAGSPAPAPATIVVVPRKERVSVVLWTPYTTAAPHHSA